MTTTWFHPALPDTTGGVGADWSRSVEMMQLRPDTRAEVLGWVGADSAEMLMSGGLLLLDGLIVAGRAELGDWVSRVPLGAYPADGFSTRWLPATRD